MAETEIKSINGKPIADTTARQNKADKAGWEADKFIGTDANGNLVTKDPPQSGIPKENDPTVPDWAKQPKKPSYTADEVGALPASTKIPAKTSDLQNDSGFITAAVNALLNYYQKSETYTRTEVDAFIAGLDRRLNAVADSDDATLDQLSEIVAYIKANKSLIDSITTSKVSVSDIVNNLTTADAKKPLSAAQGKELKGLYDALPAWAKAASKPTYSKSEVGLGNVDNVRQYSESNPPPYPVTSVNGQTGGVTVTAAGIGAATTGQVEELAATIADQQEVIDSSVLFTTQTLTEAQKAQARANIGATAGEDVEFADSVEWLNENGDTSKKYVLDDGYIYTYGTKDVIVEHNANDGTGWINQRPKNAWGSTPGAEPGVWTSPIIEIDPTTMAPVEARADTEVIISGLSKIVPVYNSSPIWVHYYKADGTQMFALNGSQIKTIGTNAEINLPMTFQLKDSGSFADSNWATVKGVRICIGISTAGDITAADVASLKINIPFFNQSETVSGWYSTGKQHSNDKATQQNSADIATLKEEVADLKEAVQKSPSASGAVWYAIGDSITYGLYSTSATEYFQPVVGQRWVDYVAQYNGYELTNIGVSGSGFVTGTTFRTIVDRNDFSGVDLVTIMLGINDWKNESAKNLVGTMDDDIATGGTIVSELRYGLEKIIGDNPYCKIILITPINAKIGSRGTEDSNWAYGFAGSGTPCGSLKSFGDKLKEVCEYYGIQVVDMSNSSVVNRKSITTILPDGIHPNLECYKALGLELARKITFA